MAKILIVDDEPDIVELIKRYALKEGYEVTCVEDGEPAVQLCEKQDFDIVIMDLMMPDMDGFTASRRIREKKDIPILMLSARGAEYDKLMGFESGVDDYVTKPFSPKELMARIKVIVRRHASSAPKTGDKLRCAGIVLDPLGHEVTIDGERAELTAKEYGILLYLMRNKGIVLTRDQILSEVWGYDYFGDDRTVDWQIKLLRGKLGKYRDAVHTIRGAGYKLEE